MIKAEIPFKAIVTLDQNKLSFCGSVEFENKVLGQKVKYGPNPTQWRAIPVVDGYDVLLNEFILKCQNNYKIPYIHEELCHCRMVATEKVINVIKQGVFAVPEVSRVTMAGTGCGSCKKDIEELLVYLIK